jgi:hypothetical protein
VRTTLSAAALATSVLRALRELNPKQPAAELQGRFRSLVDHANSPRRFFMLLVAIVCGAGTAAGGAGHLRRHLVLRDAADAGDRHSHGAGRNRRAGAEGCACQYHVADSSRDCGRDGGFAGGGAADCDDAVRHFAMGRLGVCRNGGCAGGCGGLVGVYSGAKGFADQPDGSAAVELSWITGGSSQVLRRGLARQRAWGSRFLLIRLDGNPGQMGAATCGARFQRCATILKLHQPCNGEHLNETWEVL